MSGLASGQSSASSRPKHRTFLDIVDACDTFPLFPFAPSSSSHLTTTLTDTPTPASAVTSPATATATVTSSSVAPSQSLATQVQSPAQDHAQGQHDQAHSRRQQQQQQQHQHQQHQHQQQQHQQHKRRGVSRFYARGECVGYLRHTVVETLRADFPRYFDILPVHDDRHTPHHHQQGTLHVDPEGTTWDVFVRDGVGSTGTGMNTSGARQAQRRDQEDAAEVGVTRNRFGSEPTGVSEDDTAEELTKLLNGVAQFWRTRKVFRVLEGWRDEQYTIYGANRRVLFTLERAACSLFGLVTYGAHLNVYVEANGPGAEMQLWCPRRAKTKATFPGMLDNSVAGGISNGLSPYETIVKEANEEASIPEDIARKLIRPAGCISYIYVDGDVDDVGGGGWIQPEVQYIFDLSLTGEYRTFELKPQDGESENFELWPISQVKQEMLHGNFKPNCAAVLVDFFIRHGHYEEDGSGEYLTILQRLHRSFDVPS